MDITLHRFYLNAGLELYVLLWGSFERSEFIGVALRVPVGRAS